MSTYIKMEDFIDKLKYTENTIRKYGTISKDVEITFTVEQITKMLTEEYIASYELPETITYSYFDYDKLSYMIRLEIPKCLNEQAAIESITKSVIEEFRTQYRIEYKKEE